MPAITLFPVVNFDSEQKRSAFMQLICEP
jgi:hypothetical protein